MAHMIETMNDEYHGHITYWYESRRLPVRMMVSSATNKMTAPMITHGMTIQKVGVL